MTIIDAAGSPVSVAASELSTMMTGSVITEPDVRYESARHLWNGAINRRPAIIARCANSDDVRAAVRIARTYDLPLSVRGGGHDWAGRALRDGGLVIDLRDMRQVVVDAAARTATIEGGATVGDLASAAHRYGLAPSTGSVNAVGMAGLTLGGGYGPLNGRAGLALDNLLSAEVVLADGERTVAGPDDDADLFWAIRGGGGNFGVVTTLQYRVHPIPAVLAGLILFRAKDAPSVLHNYRELVAMAPDRLTIQTGFLPGADGLPMLFVFPVWSGDLEDGHQYLTRVMRLGRPLSAQVGTMAYVDALAMFDAHVASGRHYAIETQSLAEFSDESVEVMLHGARAATTRYSGISVHHFHGAAARVPVDATAFALRREHVLVEIVAIWDGAACYDGAVHRAWARDLSDRLAPLALPGGYPNLLAPDQVERVRLAYGANFPRLMALKRRFDPDNVFDSATPTLGEP
jgi:FAD/FMN-containing dehydrogenase